MAQQITAERENDIRLSQIEHRIDWPPENIGHCIADCFRCKWRIDVPSRLGEHVLHMCEEPIASRRRAWLQKDVQTASLAFAKLVFNVREKTSNISPAPAQSAGHGRSRAVRIVER